MSMTQGIRGTVYKKTGNHMPSIGRPRRSAKTEPMEATVHALRGTHQPFDELPVDKVIATTLSDNNGNYEFKDLPPGEYTVILERGPGDYYLNSYHGAGEWTSVTVAAGEVTVFDICDSSKAYF